jgi:hypothetical protein
VAKAAVLVEAVHGVLPDDRRSKAGQRCHHLE